MRKLFWLLLVLLTVFPLHAQESTPEAAINESSREDTEVQEPLTINVGVDVSGMSEFDLEQGLYNVDFYLFLTCSRECSEDEIAIDFVGLSGTFSLNIEERNREAAYAEYRVQAVLSQNDINLRRFPFDSHHLNIILESKYYQTDTVRFAAIPEDSRVDEQVSIPGWDIEHNFELEVQEKRYYDEIGYARFIFSVELHRASTAAFIRSILPALVILVISLLSNFIPDLSQRSGFAGGVLLALLLHHLSVANGIPQVAYPVYFDAFMLLNNALILLQFSLTVAEITLQRRKMPEEIREKLSLRLLLSMISLWIIGQGILIWLFLI